MDKMINTTSLTIGMVGGYGTYLFGGWDTLLKSLATLIVIDLLTGFLKAIHMKDVSVWIMFDGIIRKVFMFIIVALAVVSSHVIGDSIPIREITIMFFIANEGLSILENSTEFINLPPQLTEIFRNIRTDENLEPNEEEEK